MADIIYSLNLTGQKIEKWSKRKQMVLNLSSLKIIPAFYDLHIRPTDFLIRKLM